MRHSQVIIRTLLAAILSVATGARGFAAAGFSLSENSGFCAGGGPGQAPIETWGSYCSQGDAGIGHAVTQTFKLNGAFVIYLSGNPTGEGLSLRLENVSDRQSLDIRPDISPGAGWLKFPFDLPDSWRGKDLRIVAEDRSTGPMGWLAFSSPVLPIASESRADAKRILLRTPLFVLLIFLPGFALSAFAIRKGIRGTVKLGMLMLAGIAMPGYVLFFVYVLFPKAGYVIAEALPFLFGGALLFLVSQLAPNTRRLLCPFLIPLALSLFATLGVLSLGYLHGGMSTPNVTASTRFSHPLPPDNGIPFLFAEGLWKGPMPKPLLGNWLSSDRPPLQTGMVLALEPWMRSATRHELWYQITSVVAQSLWIFAVWLLMKGFRIGQLTSAAVISTIYLSGFAIVNSFFVWPKLLAGAYIVAFAIPILTARPQAGASSWLLRCLMAFLLACSLLSHGGSLFALLGLILFMLLRYRAPMLKETLIVGMMTVLLYCPWIAYQKLVDPPGDRLVKYHLAGVEQVTSEPPLKTIYEAYRALTFAQWLAVKEANTAQVFGHAADYLKEAPLFLNPRAKAEIRVLEFFYCVPTLGFVGFGIAGLLLRWRKTAKRSEMKAGERLLLWAVAMTIPWILLMFESLITVVHAGPYALELMAMSGAILAFRAVAPKLALGVCAFQCIFHWMIYEPDLSNAAFPMSLALSTNHWMMALHIISLCGFFGVLAWPPEIHPTKLHPAR